MHKTVVRHMYLCDKCGKEISGSVFSPIWGELKPEYDGNYDRGGTLSIDICEECKREVEEMIYGLFKEITENDKNSEKFEEKSQKSTETVKKPTQSRGRNSELDDGKILALHRAGWSNSKIAEEMHVSGWTIGQHLKKLNTTAFEEEGEE